MVQAISRDPEIMHGVPVFRGTRVPVQSLFEYLEGGDTDLGYTLVIWSADEPILRRDRVTAFLVELS